MTVGNPPTFWIGLDDTDEREYGCTTHDFDSLIRELQMNGFVITDPKLVRLWPFAPTRTRGNAALSASIVTDDRDRLISTLEDWFKTRFDGLTIGEDTHSAQPVLLMTEVQLPESMYWDTVRSFVDLDSRVEELSDYNHHIWSTPAGCGGLIGASAAIAWKGLDDCTWECTAWRSISGPRNVPIDIVEKMSIKFPSTFMNRDPNAGQSLIAPRTPCPVLYGIRGESRQVVLDAHLFMQDNGAELSSGHRAHRTNQATDDHLLSSKIGNVNRVTIMPGGHVEIDVGIKLLSFSQGGELNRLAQSLEHGDKIEWWGLTNIDDTVHLERLRLIHGKRNRMRPLCECGSRYKSQGRNQLLKCPNCSREHEDTWTFNIIQSEWFEPPPNYRRHLSKPLSRIDKSEI